MYKGKKLEGFILSDKRTIYLLVCVILFGQKSRLNRRGRKNLFTLKKKLEKELPKDFEPVSDNPTGQEVENYFSKHNKKKLNDVIKLGDYEDFTEEPSEIDIETVEVLKSLNPKLTEEELITMSSKQAKRARALQLANLTDKAFCEENRAKLTKDATIKVMGNLTKKVYLATFCYDGNQNNLNQARADWENFQKKLKRKGILDFRSCGTFGYGEKKRGIHRHELILCDSDATPAQIINEWYYDVEDLKEIKITDPPEDISKIIFYLFKNAMEMRKNGFKIKNFLSYSGDWETKDLKHKYKQGCIEDMMDEIDNYLLSYGIDAYKEKQVTINGEKATQMYFYIPEEEWQAYPEQVRMGVNLIMAKYLE